MAATNHSWTIGDTGCGNGPQGDNDHLPGGQIDFMPTLEGGTLNGVGARDDVPYEYDFGKYADISGAPGRIDVPTGVEGYGVPAPFAGDKGQPLDFNAVAPDTDWGVTHDLDGENAPAAGDTSAAAPGVPS